MEKYVGLSEDALRKLLEQCNDFTERRRIRAAIRCAVQNGGIYDYGFDYSIVYDYGGSDDSAERRRRQFLEERIREATTEDELNDLLSLATDYQDRRKIRTAIRDMRRKKYEEEELLNNNNNSIRRQSRQYEREQQRAMTNKKEMMDLDGITDESVLERMLEEAEDFDDRRRIRLAIRELRLHKRELRRRQQELNRKDGDNENGEADSQDSDEPYDREAEEAEKARLAEEEAERARKAEEDALMKALTSGVKEGERRKSKLEEEEDEREGISIDFERVKDPKILETLLESSVSAGERAQIRSILKELEDHMGEEGLPFEMVKKRRLTEGIATDVIWLDEIDRIAPETRGRNILEEVEEEAAAEFVSYDEIKDVEVLQKMLKTAKDIGEMRTIRAAIANLKKAKEPPPPKPADTSSMDATKKVAESTTKDKKTKDDKKKPEEAKPQSKAASLASKFSKPAEEVQKKPEAPKPQSKASSLASKFSKPAEEPEPKKVDEKPGAAEPQSKASSKSSKPAEEQPPSKPEPKKVEEKPEAGKPQSKASSLASKFSKPAEEQPPSKPEPKKVEEKPGAAKPQSKASSLASKFSKPAEEQSSSKPEPKKVEEKPGAAKPQSKASSLASKFSKPAEEEVKEKPAAPKPQSKASSLASKFSKPEEEPPAPKKPAGKKTVGSLNVAGNKFAKFEKDSAADKSQPKGKEDLSNGEMVHVTVDKVEIPGGEIISKKSVSVSESPDGSFTKTTTVSTTGVKTEEKKLDSGKGFGGGVTSKTVVTREITTEQTSGTEVVTRTVGTAEQISNGIDASKKPKSGKIPEEFWKKMEEDKKKPSPMKSSSFGIGNLKNRFQGNGIACNGSIGRPAKFGKGSSAPGKIGQLGQKFGSSTSSSKTTSETTSGTKSSSCPGNGQCGTPITGSPATSPPGTPSKKASVKSSGCPGNGQCGTPLIGSPAVSPPSTPSKKASLKSSSCPGNGQCGTPLLGSPAVSPPSTPSKKVSTKSSGCPGNGQCGTPLLGSPATSPPGTPSKKASAISRYAEKTAQDVQVGKELCHGNGCPPVNKGKDSTTTSEKTGPGVKSSSCPGNGQCGTPLTGSPATSPPGTPSRKASTKSSGCPGNGQCGTPVLGSPTVSPPGTPSKKAKYADKTAQDAKQENEVCQSNGCPPPSASTKLNGPGGAIHKLGQMYSLELSTCSKKKTGNKSPIGSASQSPFTKEENKNNQVSARDEEEEDKAYKIQETKSDNQVESGDSSSKMAPVVVDTIEDENVLEKMLEDETDFEERKKIRSRLRDLRRKKRDDREKRVNEMENDMFKAMVESRQKSKDIVMESFDPKKTGSLRLSRDPISKSTTDKPEDNNNTIIKPPTSPNNNTTVSVKDDGKTSTTTTKSVKEGGGTKTVTQTTVSKTDDGSTKSKSMKTETVSKTDSLIGGGSVSSSSKTVIETSSSTSSTSTGGTKPRSTETTGTSKNVSKFDQQLEEKKKLREQKRQEEQQAWKEQMAKKKREEMEKRKREKADAEKKKASIMNKFGGAATGGAMPRGGGGMAKVGGVMNASTIKQKLLEWTQQVTRGYPNINITNFSSSWCDGMAFCAVVHRFYPEAFDFDKLNPKQRRKNFDLAFNSAEKYGDVMPLLETEDMLMMKNKPDWKCVFTYVQSLYRHFSKLQQQEEGQA